MKCVQIIPNPRTLSRFETLLVPRFLLRPFESVPLFHCVAIATFCTIFVCWFIGNSPTVSILVKHLFEYASSTLWGYRKNGTAGSKGLFTFILLRWARVPSFCPFIMHFHQHDSKGYFVLFSEIAVLFYFLGEFILYLYWCLSLCLYALCGGLRGQKRVSDPWSWSIRMSFRSNLWLFTYYFYIFLYLFFYFMCMGLLPACCLCIMFAVPSDTRRGH